jgi:hypothetical protein
MEDLIAKYPTDFFPQRDFVLKGRQESFVGVGRFDLLFRDRFNTTILMELKAVTAKYDVATQLATYKDELQRRGHTNLLMWLVAPHIPPSVREFLDRIGIEYTEIHFVEFQRVARRHGFAIRSEQADPMPHSLKPARVSFVEKAGTRPSISRVTTGPVVTNKSLFRWKAAGYDLVLVNPQALRQESFLALVDAFEKSVESRRNAALVMVLRQWAGSPELSVLPHKSIASLLRWVTTSGYKAAVPHALAIWSHLFGQPTPTWYVWTQDKGYQFYPDQWVAWFSSLSKPEADVQSSLSSSSCSGSEDVSR